jgi:hypothetical protein
VPKSSKYAGVSHLRKLETTEMNEIWAPGTLLWVVDLIDYDAALKPGNKVITVRENPEGFVEIGCREIMACHDSTVCHLIARSTDERFKDSVIPITWPIVPTNSTRAPNGDTIVVKAIVIGSISPEIEEDITT